MSESESNTNSSSERSSSERYSFLVKSAAWFASSVALTLIIVKLIAWFVTGSVSMLASLVDSTLDLMGSLCTLGILHYALQPADEDHLFGHGKAESLAALAQSLFISGSAIFLLLHSINRLIDPVPIVSPGYGIWVSIGATALTAILLLYQKRVIKLTGSQATSADYLHYKTDFIMNVSIVIALLLSTQGFTQSDALFALGISFYILYNAYSLGKEAVQTLLDHQLPIEEQKEILELILSNPAVCGCHDFRTRRGGATRFIQCHIELDDDLSFVDAHKIADELENDLHNKFEHLDVILHLDPISAVTKETRLKKQSELATAMAAASK